ncbi:MAG: glycosyl transferase family 1, partial [Proteobacteria bacterium]
GDPERRARAGAANRLRARREFDRTRLAERLGDLYARAIAAAPVTSSRSRTSGPPERR